MQDHTTGKHDPDIDREMALSQTVSGHRGERLQLHSLDEKIGCAAVSWISNESIHFLNDDRDINLFAED